MKQTLLVIRQSLSRRNLFLLACAALAIQLFQNCSLTKGILGADSFQTKVINQNNGSGYDGKPTGKFYWYVPEFSCSGNNIFRQSIELDGTGKAILVNNSFEACDYHGEPVQLSEVLTSPLQGEFISYLDVLFKRYKVQANSIPNEIAELQCRDNFENPSLEIIAHQKVDENSASLRIYHRRDLLTGAPAPSTAVSEITDFATSRVLGETSVNYESMNLALFVELSNLSTGVKRFSGTIITSHYSFLPATTKLTCILGGGLRSKGWPLKQLTSFKVSDIAIDPATQELFLTSGFDSSQNSLYKMNPSSLTLENLTEKNAETTAVNSFKILPDSNLIVFKAQHVDDTRSSSFIYDRKTKLISKIVQAKKKPRVPASSAPAPVPDPSTPIVTTAPVATTAPVIIPESDESNDFEVDSSGKDGLLFEVSDFGKDRKYLRYQKKHGEKPIEVANKSRRGLFYQHLKSQKQVVVLNDDQKSLSVVNLVTGAKETVTPSLPPNCALSGNLMRPVNNGRAVLVSQNGGECSNGRMGRFRIIELNKGDSTTTKPAQRHYLWSDEKGLFGIFANLMKVPRPNNPKRYDEFVDPTQISLVRFSDNSSFNVPINPIFGREKLNTKEVSNDPAFFLKQESKNLVYLEQKQLLYGLTGNINNPDLSEVDIGIGNSRNVCEATQGKKVFVGKFSENRVALINYDEQFKIFYFYTIDENGDCKRINEFPTKNSVVKQFESSFSGLVLVLKKDSKNKDFEEVIFVPANGGAPMRINDEGRNLKKIRKVTKSLDSKKIYILGDTYSLGKQKLFLFNLEND